MKVNVSFSSNNVDIQEIKCAADSPSAAEITQSVLFTNVRVDEDSVLYC